YSKDVGVIADKTGFIVCAGGSAGYNPRIADVIIKDISEEEALKVVDNIFDYYKENAEAGEKLGFFIERIGLEKFKEKVNI
ncbi:NAD(P)/FAD-dependent oxidoreductase, partial [Clostridium botulinum]|nr:NAD(P)/FAD-dependent oxidoreductase [Clostridium botulinum]